MTTITLHDGSSVSLPPADRLAGSNCGTPGVWHFAGAAPGPRLIITALVHGNEVCGAAALAPLLDQPPALARGELILVFCNLQAYARLDDATKANCRFADEDMNRVWGRLDGAATGQDTYEVRRAREILPFLETADALLDLHSMTSPAPALGLVGLAPKNVDFARRVGFPPLLVQDTGHAQGKRMIDRETFASPAAAPVAMLVECGAHFSREALDAAADVVRRTMAAMLQGQELAPPAEQSVLEVTSAVTIESDAFEFVQDWPNMSCVPTAGTLLGRDGAREVRTPHDDAWLVMPASRAFWKRGLTAVRFGRRVE